MLRTVQDFFFRAYAFLKTPRVWIRFQPGADSSRRRGPTGPDRPRGLGSGAEGGGGGAAGGAAAPAEAGAAASAPRAGPEDGGVAPA